RPGIRLAVRHAPAPRSVSRRCAGKRRGQTRPAAIGPEQATLLSSSRALLRATTADVREAEATDPQCQRRGMRSAVRQLDPPRLVLVTNIPTPYRLHFCRVLDGALSQRGWSFEVWFMAPSHRRRDS